MDIEHVREFARIVEVGSFTQAASICHTTQPAVSRHIADLERELGCELLVRSAKTCTPTIEGRLFYEGAVRLLEEYDATRQRLGRMLCSPRTSLRVLSFVGYKPTDDLLFRMRRASLDSGQRLELQTADITREEPPFELLASGGVDLVLSGMPAGVDLGRLGVDLTEVVEDELVAIVDRHSRLAEKGGPVAMADIGTDVVWTYRDHDLGGFYEGIDTVLLENGARPTFSSLPWSGARRDYREIPFRRGGIQITLRGIARHALPERDDAPVCLRFTDKAARHPIYAFWRRADENPALLWALDFMREAAERQGSAE